MNRLPSSSGRRGRLLGASPLLLVLGIVVLVAALAVGGIALAARVGDEPRLEGIVTQGTASARTYPYLLQPSGGPEVRVSLEVAADDPSRQRGLSRREEVPPGTGMAFLFPADTSGAFWMKDTLVPLQIAFVAADGRVVSLHEMTPCRADPCPVTEPAGPYRYAVELAAGAFSQAGVRAGDRVVPEDPSSLPDPG